MTAHNNTLTSLPNIGSVLANRLIQAEILTPNDLFEAGAEKAFIRMATVNTDVCIQMLWALEGAIQGVRWHSLSSARKNELKEFYELVTKGL